MKPNDPQPGTSELHEKVWGKSSSHLELEEKHARLVAECKAALDLFVRRPRKTKEAMMLIREALTRFQ